MALIKIDDINVTTGLQIFNDRLALLSSLPLG
jgi:hypothetical protein